MHQTTCEIAREVFITRQCIALFIRSAANGMKEYSIEQWFNIMKWSTSVSL